MSGWQPQQYDPRQHQQRIGAPQYPPQPPSWQQPGYGQPPQPPAPKPRLLRGCLTFIVLAAVTGIIIAVATSGSPPPSSAPPAAGAPAAPQPANSAPQTVTYIVTGSAADVTYGPAGSDTAGTVPMHKTKALGSPAYYAISAQLQGGGSVSCRIEVNGAVVSSATATGSYNIASCEITQDPLSGNWTDANSA